MCSCLKLSLPSAKMLRCRQPGSPDWLTFQWVLPSLDWLTDFPVSALVLRLWPGFLALLNDSLECYIQLQAIHSEQDPINTVLRPQWLGRIPLKDADNSIVLFFFTQQSERGNHKFTFHMLSLSYFILKKKVSQNNTCPEYWFYYWNTRPIRCFPIS